jgi:pimeloyl-ACP methyl ester carboxylesterase
MPILEGREHRVSYVEVGSGEQVVLVHCGPGTAAQWRQVCEALKDAYRLLAVNLHGVGETSVWDGPGGLTLDDEARLLRELIASAGPPVHLVGHSYGGAVSIRVALTGPLSLRSLTLIEPMIYPLLRSAGEDALYTETMRVGEAFLAAAKQDAAEEAWKQFTDYYNGAGAWAALPESARTGLLARTAVTIQRWHALMSNPTSAEDCRRLRVPTVVLCGDRTSNPERRMSEIVASVIPGCRIAFIEGAGHMSPLTHPPGVAGAIRSHLERVDSHAPGA